MSRPGITGISFAYPGTPANERARLALGAGELRQALRRLAVSGEYAFLLSTCLRFELAVPGDRGDLERALKTVFGDRQSPSTGVIREGEHEIAHLFRVAAGVESPLLGEPEVLGQFRAAAELGRREGAIGGLFEQVLAGAVGAGRAARRLLAGSPSGSLARTAADMASGFEDVSVFGAGAMARAVVEGLSGVRPSPRVTVYARRPDRVELPAVDVRPLEEASRALSTASVAVSATSAKDVLFTPDLLRAALDERREELLLIDLAMPPDVLPPADAARLRYVGVDELAARALGAEPPEEVSELLASSAGAMAVRLANHDRAAPVIAGLLEEADRTVAEEVERFAPRLGADAEDRRVLEQLARTVARRLLHAPISYLSSDRHGVDAAEVLAEAFGVEGDEHE